MDFSRLAQYLDGMPDAYGMTGCDMTVWQEHKELFRHHAGYRDAGKTTPMNGDELYFFYSATKPITCTAIMQLFEQGKIAMNDPVSLYLPEYANVRVKRENGELTAPATPISIRHLLTMTAGMDYNLGTVAVREATLAANGNPSTRDVVRALAETPLAFDPGTKWQYALCHDVLAAVVEVVSGMRYSAYVKKYVFDPLGMTESCFSPDGLDLSRFPDPISLRSDGTPVVGQKRNKLVIGNDYESGGASLISTVSDYILFTDAMANGGVGKTGERILDPKTISLMALNATGDFLSKYCDFGEQMDGYGYGYGVRTMIDPSRGGSLSPVGEFGWDGAWGTYLVIDPINRLSLTFGVQLGDKKPLIHPRLRNLTYLCLNA